MALAAAALGPFRFDRTRFWNDFVERRLAHVKEIDPIPLKLHVACFVIAGIVVSIAYSFDWKQVFG